MKETRTIKIRTDDYRVLKVLAAKRGITMLALISQMVEQARKDTARGVGSATSEERI